MVYGAEAWALGRHRANKLLVTEIKFWRSTARKTRKNKIKKNGIENNNRKKTIEMIWTFKEDEK